MKFEQAPPPPPPQEHVGAGQPHERATEATKRIAQAMDKNEEALREAVRAGKIETINTIRKEQTRLADESRKIRQHAAENKKFGLAG